MLTKGLQHVEADFPSALTISHSLRARSAERYLAPVVRIPPPKVYPSQPRSRTVRERMDITPFDARAALPEGSAGTSNAATASRAQGRLVMRKVALAKHRTKSGPSMSDVTCNYQEHVRAYQEVFQRAEGLTAARSIPPSGVVCG